MTESITGAAQFEELGARMTTGAAAVNADLQAVLHAAARPLVDRARANARSLLPKAGGLNDRVANSEFVVQDRPSSIMASVRIGTTASDTRATNRGHIRHPVYGHRDRWTDQPYAKGADWFDNAMRDGRLEVEAAVTAALESVARAVTGA